MERHAELLLLLFLFLIKGRFTFGRLPMPHWCYDSKRASGAFQRHYCTSIAKNSGAPRRLIKIGTHLPLGSFSMMCRNVLVSKTS